MRVFGFTIIIADHNDCVANWSDADVRIGGSYDNLEHFDSLLHTVVADCDHCALH